ncbi:putative transcription factor WRKY family [Helianthus debilis subsp. tardiflorus]
MVTTRSKSLSNSEPVKIPTDRYAWILYGRTPLKSPDGFRSYYKCKHSACQAKKVEYCDKCNSIIDVVYKGQHKHDPPKKVILKGGNVLSTAKSLKRRLIPTHGLEEHLIEAVRNDDATTVIAPPTLNRITRSRAIPATTKANADVAEAVQNVTTRSKPLSASKPIKIPTDSYAWLIYGRTKVKSPEGSRSYFRCKYSVCQAKKVVRHDQYHSIIDVVYKGQHKHDPPNIVTSKGRKVPSTTKSLKGKSISTVGSKEHLTDVHIDGSEIKQRLKRNSSESSVIKHPKKPKFIVHAIAGTKASADSYKWRKYRQKMAKGNSHPRLKRNSSESSVVIHPKKPKFIVHATAGTKVSADSYKWRKYRQKMVKGNSHPRNCYKCAFAGCTVKKQMEKVVDGSSQVIITYKGLHNHDIPAASSHSKERVPSSFTQSPTMPPTPAAIADVAETEQKATTLSKSLSTSKPIKIPTDSYAWMKYARRQLKSPYGFRSYSKCKHRACQAKKVELYDQFNSVADVVYKGQHKHDPPNIVISKGGKDLSTAKSLKGKLISEVVHVDGLEIKQRLKRNSSESSVLKHPKKPKFIVHAAAETKVSSDSYKWRKYREKMVKGNPHPRCITYSFSIS